MSRLLVVIAVIVFPLQAAQAASPRELIEQGNEHYAAGRYTEALQSYEEAAAASGGNISAELLHDQAAAQFKLGKLDEARELWVRALSLKDAAFEASVRYNIGNCHYAEALKQLQSGNGQGIMDILGRAIQQYRDALRLDPSLESARANLELTYQLKQKLEEQATTQPQSQPSSQQSGDQKQKQDQQQQSTQPSDQQNQGDSSEQDKKNESSSTQPSTQPTSQPNEPPSTQPDSEEPQSQPSPPSTQPDEGVPQTQPDQSPPSTQPAGQEEQRQPSSEDQPTRMIRMSREQAERLLQQIRDAEKMRRRALLQREAARQKPVDRDW